MGKLNADAKIAEGTLLYLKTVPITTKRASNQELKFFKNQAPLVFFVTEFTMLLFLHTLTTIHQGGSSDSVFKKSPVTAM